MHPKYKIFMAHANVYAKTDPTFIQYFQKQNVELNYFLDLNPPPQEEIDRMFSGCDICLVCSTPITAQMMDLAPDLKLIAVYGSGYNNVDIDAARNRGIYVTNARGGNATAVAELTIAHMLNLSRGFVDSANQVKQNVWNSYMGGELRGKTLGIMGMGAIGGEVARIASRGFDMQVLAYDPYVNQQYVQEYGVCYTGLDDVFAQSDFLSIHAPLLSDTYSSIDYRLLCKMKPTAYLINTARGGIINEADLLRALDEGRLAGAGLDVFENEPFNTAEKNNPFAAYPQLKVQTTPHMAACTTEAVQRLSRIVIENVEDIIAGRRPRHNIVNGL